MGPARSCRPPTGWPGHEEAEVARGADPGVRRFLTDALRLSHEDVCLVDGPLQLADLMALTSGMHPRDARDEPATPARPRFRDAPVRMLVPVTLVP